MGNDNEGLDFWKHSVRYQVLDPKKGLPNYEIEVYARRDDKCSHRRRLHG